MCSGCLVREREERGRRKSRGEYGGKGGDRERKKKEKLEEKRERKKKARMKEVGEKEGRRVMVSHKPKSPYLVPGLSYDVPSSLFPLGISN